MKKALAMVLSLMLMFGAFSAADATTTEFSHAESVFLFTGMSVVPHSMNPMAGDTAFPVSSLSNVFLVYEALFMMNQLTGELEPLIGDSYEPVDDMTVEVKINPNVTFSDGTPCTAADVAYSYELGKKYDVAWTSYWQYLESIEVVDDYTLRFHQNPENPNYLCVLDSFQSCYVLPKAIWEKIEADNNNDIGEIRKNFTNMDGEGPIGTGCYKLHSYNDQQTVLVRNENYWGVERFGKLPSAKYIINPHFASNDALTLAFRNNEIDYAQAFIPQIWTLIKENPKIATYLDESPYHLEGGMVSIMCNLSKPGLDNKEVRRALAYCINYKLVGEMAMSGYTKELSPMLALNNGVENKYVDMDAIAPLQYSYDPAKAIEILDSIGAVPGPDGIRVLPDGTRLSFTIQTGYGWTDWNAAAEIVSQSAKAVGLEVKSEMPEGAIFMANRQTGDFDLALTIPGEGIRPSQPWYRYWWIMSDKGVPPVGELAFSNQMRFHSERANEIVDLIPKTTDEAELKALHTELNTLFLDELPLIPIMYRPFQFYEVNNTYWTGWPKEGDGTNIPPMADRYAALKIFFNIQPAQ